MKSTSKLLLALSAPAIIATSGCIDDNYYRYSTHHHSDIHIRSAPRIYTPLPIIVVPQRQHDYNTSQIHHNFNSQPRFYNPFPRMHNFNQGPRYFHPQGFSSAPFRGSTHPSRAQRYHR
ncbi:MAG: hypothetical protein AABX30_03245 [Nanoarchaeota archaeon]